MVAVLGKKKMARKVGRPKGDRNDVSVKVDKSVVSMAKFVAMNRGVSVAELLSGMLAGPMEREYVKLVAKADRDAKAERDAKAKGGGE